jgi:hypothetical protein
VLNRICVILAGSALLVVAGAARADEARAPTEAEAVAAMERAKRQAANPMLRILEASKMRRRVVDTEATDGAAEAGTARRTAPTATGALVAASAAGDGPASLGTHSDAAPTALVTNPAPPSDPNITVQVTLSSGALQGRSALASVPALEGPSAMVSLPPKSQALPEPTLPAALTPTPKLVSMVEPEIPPRLLAGLGAALEVTAELVIRPDGRVASVVVPSTAHRQLNRFVVEALLQWVYEPLPTEQAHRVQLVFNAGN